MRTLVTLLLIIIIASCCLNLPSVSTFSNIFSRNIGKRNPKEIISNMDGENTITNTEKFSINATHIRALVGNISKFISPPGGFAQRIKGEPLINATFYGILSLMLTGNLEIIKENLSAFLEYLYDNSTFMFRDWLGGEPNILSTGYGVLIMKMTNVTFSEFNKTETYKRLYNSMVSFISGNDTFNLTMPDIIIVINALYVLNESLILEYRDEIINSIMKFYHNGAFYDPRSGIMKLQQTYMAVNLIRLLNHSISNAIREEIKHFILSLKYDRNQTKFIGGFGEGEIPTARETGLAISLLKEIDYLDENISKNAEIFLSRCVNLSTKIQKYPGGPKADLYDMFFILLGAHSLGIITKYTSIKILSDLQVPIDVSTAYLDVNVSVLNEDLDFATVYYLIKNKTFKISGQCSYIEHLGYYKIELKPQEIGFGGFTLIIFVNFSYPLTPFIVINKTDILRIGYKMTLSISTRKLNPGANLTIHVDVTYNNGSVPRESYIIIRIIREYSRKVLNFAKFSLNDTNGSVTYTWKASENVALGLLKVESYVNDSWGCNHTRRKEYVILTDLLNFTVSGNKSDYCIGEIMTFNFTLRYSSTDSPVPLNEAMKLEICGMAANIRWFNITYYPVNNSTYGNGSVIVNNDRISATIQLPTWLPLYGYTRIVIYLTFDPNVTVTTTEPYLFKFNVSVKDLTFKELNIGETFIGERLNVSFLIVSNRSNAILINASFMVKIINGNETLQIFRYFWNDSIYVTNDTVNPNIPIGNYTIEFWLNATHLHKFVKINTTENITIEISGVPTVKNYVILPQKPMENSAIILLLNIVCNETNRTLSGLILGANISYGSHTISTLVRETQNHTYIISMYADKAGEYNVTIFREQDNLVIFFIKLEVEKRPTLVLSFLEQYGGGLWIVAYIMCFIVLWIVRVKFGKKVSRLWLERK